MGTENAWCIVGDEDTSGYDPTTGERGFADGPDGPPATPTYFEVSGYSGNLEFHGYYLASSEMDVRRAIGGWGLTDLTINETKLAAPLEVTWEMLRKGFLFVEDEEAARLLGTLYLHKPVSEQETYPHGPKKAESAE